MHCLGFDNLHNLDTGRIDDISYSKCMLSDDGHFVLPDDVYLIPVYNSDIDYSADVYEHFNSYVSTTSASINVEASIRMIFQTSVENSLSNTKISRVKW